MADTIKAAPAEVLKVAKRLRAKGSLCICMHLALDMPSATEGRFYPYRTALADLTMKQLTRMMDEAQRFSDNKVADGQAAANVEYSINSSELGGTFLWIHG